MAPALRPQLASEWNPEAIPRPFPPHFDVSFESSLRFIAINLRAHSGLRVSSSAPPSSTTPSLSLLRLRDIPAHLTASVFAGTSATLYRHPDNVDRTTSVSNHPRLGQATAMGVRGRVVPSCGRYFLLLMRQVFSSTHRRRAARISLFFWSSGEA